MAQVVNLDDFSPPPLPSARRSNDVERRIEKEGKEGREDKGQGGDGPPRLDFGMGTQLS